jgi:small subunit ribosomal protein S4
MGDIKRPKKKYETPAHPWEKERIDAERDLVKNYGLTNKKEIWKATTLLKNFKEQAKRCATLRTEQQKKEKVQLLDRLRSLNLITIEGNIDDVLGLKTEDILKRRLQTMVFEKKLANTVKQARQLLIHGHVTLSGKKVTVPSYLVRKDEEDKIGVALSVKNE